MYQYDEKTHRVIEKELGLEKHNRQLLEIASILHDIGMFIRGSDHQLHSHYIILHSDIFGIFHNLLGTQ